MNRIHFLVRLFSLSRCEDTTQDGRKATWKTAKKFEDVELQGLLDEHDSQIQKQLAEKLGVS